MSRRRAGDSDCDGPGGGGQGCGDYDYDYDSSTNRIDKVNTYPDFAHDAYGNIIEYKPDVGATYDMTYYLNGQLYAGGPDNLIVWVRRTGGFRSNAESYNHYFKP